MAQHPWTPMDATVDDGVTLVDNLNHTFPAVYSNHAGSSIPLNPVQGQLWVDTAALPVMEIKQYDGAVWRSLWTVNVTTGEIGGSFGSGSGGGASVTVADTPPANPNPGDLWWDSTVGVLRVYYEDANSSQWVDATPQGVGITVDQADARYAQQSYVNSTFVTKTDADDRYLDAAGDTMVGALYFSPRDGGAILTSSNAQGSSGVLTTDFGGGNSINLQNLITGGLGRSRFVSIGAPLTGGAPTTYIDLRSDTNITRTDGLFAQFISVSDERVKTNVLDFTFDALSALQAIRVVSFEWRSDTPYGKSDPVTVGFTAQDVRAHIPEVVRLAPVVEDAPPDTLMVDTSLLVPYLVRAIQQQQDQISKLRNELAAMKGAL